MSRERRMLSYGLLGIAMFCLITCFGSFSYEMNSSGPSGREESTVQLGLPHSPWFYYHQNAEGWDWQFRPFSSVSGWHGIVGMITFYYFWKINKYDNKYENFSKFKKNS
ncbi:MAG: hypothetical protein ACOX5R_13525 [bacterium]|jgi:hypothetical protein